MTRAIDITTDKVRTYIAQRQHEGASNGSINRELSALKRMFTLALQAGKLTAKPYIPTLEENNARQGFLTHGNFLALRDALPEHLKDPVTFLYFSGWRVSEMRKLERRDVDLAGKVVRLRPEISKNKEGRVLPLDEDLLDVIDRAMQNAAVGCPRLFHDSGEPIGNFRKSWNTACALVGLGKFVEIPGTKKKQYVGTLVHDMRRTAVRNMVAPVSPNEWQ